MLSPTTIKKLALYKKNPELVKEINPTELAELVISVLGAVGQIEEAIKAGRLDGYTPQPGKDYLSKQEAVSILRDFMSQTDSNIKTISEALQTDFRVTVQQILEDIQDGEDGFVTDEEIARAAEIASQLVVLPDFEELIATTLTESNTRVRDGLELLQGDERLSAEAISGLDEKFKALEERLSALTTAQRGGGIGKNQVYNFIRSAVADGTIQTSSLNIAYGTTEPSNPEDGDLWVDTNVRYDLPVTSADIRIIIALTQAEYDALTPDATTLYVITS